MNTQSAAITARLGGCLTLALLLPLAAGCLDSSFDGEPGGAAAAEPDMASAPAVARAETTTKTFIDYLQPTPITCSPLSSATWGVADVLPRDLCNGIESARGAGVPPEYYYWDGQILKARDGRYHMFMSTWSGSAGFNPGWTGSDAYHAISQQGVLGPYQRQGYVYTNNGSHKGHNVSALELPDGTYAVVVSETVPFTIYKSSSLDGPWTGCQASIQANGITYSDGNFASNVSLIPRHDGKFEIVQRHGHIGIADTLCGPYKLQKPTWTYPSANRPTIDSIYPRRTSIPGVPNPTYAWEEDPHIWRSGGLYHVLYSGSGDRVGWHLYSPDGINNWTDGGLSCNPRLPEKMFGYQGSTVLTKWYKMERPGVVLENGRVTHVTWAVADVDKDNQIPANSNHGSKVVVIPFDGVAFEADYGGGGTGGAGGTGGSGGAGGSGGSTGVPNTAPTIASPAAAATNPVTGTATALSALGADDAGEANLTYTWAATGTPPAAVTFSPNGSNAAKATTATFTKAGSYTLQVTVRDQPGLVATSSVVVNVDPTLTSVAISPAGATVPPLGTQPFTASARDQFTTNLTTQPGFTWTVSGGGTISTSGLFTAGSTVGGPYTITAQAGTVSGTASVTIGSVVYQINCGSSSAPAPFKADQYVSGGTQRTVSNTITISGITNPAPAAVYQSERYGNSTYTLPGLTAGAQYTVRLHFAELYWTASGKRKFNVVINGTTVLSSFDIYATAGANYRAVVRELSATANSSGQIVINFNTVTDNASIEGIEVLTAVPPPPNDPPTITSAAAASPDPVTGTSAALSVLGADDGGEPSLTYTWATTGSPPASVTFSANGSNAAKNTTATFSKAGSYTLQATVRDQAGLTTTSSVTVAVSQTPTSVAISPASATVAPSGTQQLTATARDQFASNLTTQPTFTWTVSGGGSISSTGLYTAGTTAGGPYTVTASSGSLSGTASVTVGASAVAVYQLNCGSRSAASPFKADQYASGGTQRTVSNTITISGITNPAPAAVYRSERYGNSTYTLPGLSAGAQYTVRLHFAELYWTASGKRKFDVVINGSTVLSSFDIYAAAGGNYKAVVRELTTTANSSGQIVINFKTVTDNASIEGIEIIRN